MIGPILVALAACHDEAATLPSGESTTTQASSSSGEPTATTTADTSSSATGGSTTDASTSSTQGSSSDGGFVPAVCGDGVVEGDEECEDGNREPDDGCDNACNRSGVLLWSMDWDGPAGTNDGARGLAVAGDGTFVVVGHEGGIGTAGDIFVGLRAADGSEIWHRSHDESGELDDASRVIIDADGGFVVIGFTTAANILSVWLRRYDVDGGESWTYADAGVDAVGAHGVDIAADAAGQLYAAVTWDRSSGASDAVVLVLDGQTGTAIDSWPFPAAAGFDARARGIAFDGDILFLTTEATATEGTNAVLRRVDVAGSEIWSAVEHGDGEITDEIGHALRIAPDGEIAVVGEVDREGQGREVWTARYDADGTLLWTRTFHRSPDVDDQGNAVDLDATGEVYLTGAVAMPGQSSDLFVRRYASDGSAELWTSTWDDPRGHLVDEGNAIAVLPDGVLVAGTTSVPGAGENAILRKYSLGR